MAETAVSLIIDKLTPLLAQGVEWLRAGSDLHNQVSDIKNELQSIQSFLRDADEKAEKEEHINSGVETWVKQVREVAYRIEDVIDEYILHVARHGHTRQGSCTLHHLKKIFSSLQTLKLQRDLASEIQSIKASLREVKERKDRYGFLSSTVSRSVSNSWWHDPRVASHFITAAEVFGIKDAQRELIGWLLGEPPIRTVVAVVGMGGLGKSTLAKTVYDNPIVKEHFLCSAWITVSQSYKLKELLRNLVRQFCPAENCFEETQKTIGMSEELQLITNLRNCLQGKRYLVVLDDIWNLDFWDQIEQALPNDNVGARVLITTRNNDVATFCKKSAVLHVHKLQPLPQNLALELFCKKAFQFDSDGDCPKMLESLSLDIVRKCGGLPLAIVALGGLFSTKDKTVPEWQRLYDRLQSELDHNPHLANIGKILSLSYRDLPYYLKCCFLYFGAFPENYSISVTRLVRGWIAEGFVQANSQRTLEQVAEEYVTELIQRNMILWYPKSDGVDIFCKVHDLMHETIISLIGKLSFCQVLVGEKENTCFNAQTRRLSIHCKIGNIINFEEHSSIRSVFIFDRNELAKSFMYKLFESCKLLKVLDLEDCPSFNYLPKNVGNLLHLKYLSLRNTKLKKLPKTIGKLLNLQTLSLRDTQVQELPREIYKLRSLRHLICGSENKDIDFGLGSTRGTRIGKGIGKWKELQTLIGVEAAEDWVEELKMLTELRVLVINNVTAEIARTLCEAIKNMNHLETLDVSSKNEDEVLDLDWILNPPPRLLKLTLRGRLKKLPHWINSQLQNVVTIRLYFSRLMDDPMKDLRALPNLVHVILDGAYCGERLHVEEGWFQELEVLTLGSMERLSTLTARKGALPRLRELVIGPSPHMKELPHDIIYISNLKTLEIRDMPREFLLRILPNQGQDCWKIERIPVVKISFKIRGQHYQVFRLGDSGLLKHLKV